MTNKELCELFSACQSKRWKIITLAVGVFLAVTGGLYKAVWDTHREVVATRTKVEMLLPKSSATDSSAGSRLAWRLRHNQEK